MGCGGDARIVFAGAHASAFERSSLVVRMPILCNAMSEARSVFAAGEFFVDFAAEVRHRRGGVCNDVIKTA